MTTSRLMATLCLAACAAAAPAAGAAVPAKKKPPKSSRGPRGPRGPQGPKGDIGPAGAAGPKGDKGDKGDAGPAGTTIVQTMTGGMATTGANGANASYPLSNPTWTQPAGRIDFVVGSATVTSPASCSGGGTLKLSVTVDGSTLHSTAVLPPAAGTTAVVPLVWLDTVGALEDLYMPPAAATLHAASATVGDTCTGGSENYVVNSVSLAVLGVS